MKRAPAKEAQVSGSGLGQAFGGLLFLGGVAGAVYYFQFFETTVETAIGRIGNLPRMHEQQQGTIVSIAVAALGLTLMLALRPRR
jgi:hypothetical protein